ncbi:uncharacterized protein LOC112597953 [Melanaphis sacchari]|uniref:uncharacterized protein LOC112597953 n=1 Tax=Melanaphis sacchari TaxID=742174 RepID=UPI000DC14FB9|nr:uncharacterized protein LOC112597953 [Melanaphis sacchari]XP_025200002.1 uncharacterized protein LOC112597953 [Melanaphis sacchari]
MIFDTTNRSDFTWPFLAERQQIFDWNRYEFKAGVEHTNFLAPQSFCNVETLQPIPYAKRLRFDFDCHPKPILNNQRPTSHYPTEKVIEYDKEKADARSNILKTRPRVFKCPQISLDDVSTDRRDMICTFVYSTSKTMSELTSGVPEGHPIPVDITSKPFADPGKFQKQSLYKTINPAKNWRRVSIEWDESQKRIFGGRFIN